MNMEDFLDDVGQVPFPFIFPGSSEGMESIRLPQKVGKAKAGDYHLFEAYCVKPGCDCRRVTLFFTNNKGKPAAVIEFGFDPDQPLAGPFLSPREKQSAGAADLLDIVVEIINEKANLIKGMYRRYKQVRKKIDGRAYRGKAFPKPGAVERVAASPPKGVTFQHRQNRVPGGPDRKIPVQGVLFPKTDLAAGGGKEWIEQYREDLAFDGHGARQTEVRAYIHADDRVADGLAAQLVALFNAEDERLDAALRLLRDILEILRVDLERRRQGAAQRMERWQTALARHVFAEGVSHQLGAMVTQELLDSRVEILPLLHEANSRRMFDVPDADTDFVPDPELAMLELLRELEEEGAGTPFELCEAILQMMAVGDVEVQTSLCRMMLAIDQPVVREAAALLLFHPQAEVRAGVAQILAEVDGRCLTPATLRRLIVSRNWCPETLSAHIDRAIANARRARVECAPLSRRVEMTVYASAVDGAQAQTFQIMVPDGKGFLCCAIMPKKGSGVADAFLVPLAGKRERKEFLAMLGRETGAAEVSADYLDRRLCQALADGAAQGKVPCHWLVAIAEHLGRDQWKAVPLDVDAELAALRAELERRGEQYLTERYRQQALEASEFWPDRQSFARSWFEDDVEVDTVVTKVMKSRARNKDSRCIDEVFKQIIEPRRRQWLERLVLTALWLKAAPKPPIPWEQMAHVALAVSDQNRPLETIPLMETITDISIVACEARLKG